MNKVKKIIYVLLGTLLFPFVLFAQETTGEEEAGIDTPLEIAGREIENSVDAVKTAQPGDYILLPSGNKYILTKEEIMIAGGVFDYGNLSDVATETGGDGTEIRTISGAHEIHTYPDGRTVHVIRTNFAFTSFLEYLKENYHLMQYLDTSGILHESKPLDSPDFDVFRVFVHVETISNGFEELESLAVTAYNYEGNNFTTKYCSVPDMVWGLVSSEELYKNTAARSISEKWEITTPGSAYSSFEFNRDHNYIVVENAGPIRFGRYTMPAEDIINMENLGVLRVNEDKDGLHLSFTPIGGTEMNFTASKAQKLPESAELDLFTRSWRVVNGPLNSAGLIIIFSNAGTYFVYEIDGSVRTLSRWQWINDSNEEWEFSHNNWQTKGGVRNIELRANYLKLVDPVGTYELVPAND
jgi:hypothetical protein